MAAVLVISISVLVSRQVAQQSMHLTLGILCHFQAFFYAADFLASPSSAPAPVSPKGDDGANRWAAGFQNEHQQVRKNIGDEISGEQP